MEFKKTRQKVKEERERTRAPTMTPAPATPPGNVAPSRVPERQLQLDPLAEFLAQYDDGQNDEVDDDLEIANPEDERRFLSFDLAGETYAASIMDIREILKLVALTEVPRAPKEVLGVLSKRGLVMPVVDLASLLGLRTADRDVKRDQRVLVVGDGDRVCGLRVDRVSEVVRLGTRAIEEVPPSLGTRNAHMLLGLGRTRVEDGETAQMLILLDIEAVLVQLAEAMGVAVKDNARGDSA